MSYIDSNLLIDEKVLYRAKRHWMIFKWPAIWLALSLFGFSFSSGFGTLLLVFGVAVSVEKLLNYLNSEFALTNKRLIMKMGFIKRQSVDVLLTKVQGLHVKQGVFGNMFNYGTVTVTGIGGSPDGFNKVSDPVEFRKKVQEQISVLEGQVPTKPAMS